MYQIIDYDQDTKLPLLFYDNIGKSKSIGLSFNTSYSLKKMVGTAIKYWSFVWSSYIWPEGYKFNNSGVSYSGAVKPIIYFIKRLERYLE
jgi:hypothetical protein